MSVIVDHEQRRMSILEHAFALFAESGYDGVTYQKIADRCKISRTSIYRYFRTKEQIFDYAVKQATGKINTMIEKVLDRADWSPKEKIVRIMRITAKMLEDNRVFLSVVLEYLLSQKNSGADVRRKVRRHTFGMQFMLQRLLQKATEQGELSVQNPEVAAAHLYGLLESFVLNLTVTDIYSAREHLYLVDSYIDQL
ncbi:MAG: TetR/AcrR family transcriptional regulator [Planctomycetaceae bacterium]|nr:TetR/AcrR family transcriptional regulator [Planctomycetaceae bacterium]